MAETNGRPRTEEEFEWLQFGFYVGAGWGIGVTIAVIVLWRCLA